SLTPVTSLPCRRLFRRTPHELRPMGDTGTDVFAFSPTLRRTLGDGHTPRPLRRLHPPQRTQLRALPCRDGGVRRRQGTVPGAPAPRGGSHRSSGGTP